MTKARTLADNFAADINGITAGTGITGGGTSGTVTVTNSMATAIDAKGDLVVGTGADTFGRLAVASTAGYLLAVDSGETTGLKWAAPAGGGKVKGIANTQTGTVATGTTILPFDDTIPQNTEGDQYMSLAYTPTSASNKLQIDIFAFGSLSANSLLGMALFQDNTANALAGNIAYSVGGPTETYILSLRHTMTAGTTSSTTFKVRIGPSDPATFTFAGRSGVGVFNGVASCSLTVTEYEV
jgi:hypothetical protein